MKLIHVAAIVLAFLAGVFLFSPFIVEAATGALGQLFLSIIIGVVIGAIVFLVSKIRADKLRK